MAEDNTFVILIKLDNLEVELFVDFCLAAIFLNEVFGSSETFNTVRQSNYSALVEHLNDSAFMHGTHCKYSFEYIPGIFFELLVTEAQATVVLVDLENFHFDIGTNLCEFAGVFDFLGPGQVADMDKAIDAFFDFNKYTEVGEVAHTGSVAAADRIFDFDIFPRIFLELFDTEAHLAVVAVEGKDYSLHFVADFQEILSGTEVLRPRHLADMYKTFYAGSDFKECAIIGHDNNFAIDLVANLKLCVESIPGMGLELLEAEGDALLLVIEVENDDIEFLVEFDNFAGMVHATPGKVGDVYKTVDTAKVDEYAIGGDVLDSSFEHLTLFELGNDLALLLLEFGFDKSLV